jgi:VanZ family protein
MLGTGRSEASRGSAAAAGLGRRGRLLRGAAMAQRWGLVLGWMGLIYYLSAQSSPPGTGFSPWLGTLGHLVEYGVLAGLLRWALGLHSIGLPAAALVSLVGVCAYALLDEYHQGMVSERDASWLDLAVDAGGGALVLVLSSGWERWRRSRHRRRHASGNTFAPG